MLGGLLSSYDINGQLVMIPKKIANLEKLENCRKKAGGIE